MTKEFQRARIYQILALNDVMLQNGYISPAEHDFVRHLQTEKLTKMQGYDIIKTPKNAPN